MKILVTGAKGFVGQNLVESLKNLRDNKDRTRPNLVIEEIYEYDKETDPKLLEEFCEKNQMEKPLLLTKLKYIIKKEFDYEIFGTIIQYCPLKYYIIKFNKNTFIIKPLFPFMQNIINFKLKEKECDEYFIKERYKRDIIANNYVKGDYFEASAKYEIQKLKLPHFDSNKTEFEIVTLNEIVSMDKIIYDDDFSEDYQDDNSSEENKIEKETFFLKNNKIEINNINTNIERENKYNETPAEMDNMEVYEQKEASEEEEEEEELKEEDEKEEEEEETSELAEKTRAELADLDDLDI